MADKKKWVQGIVKDKSALTNKTTQAYVREGENNSTSGKHSKLAATLNAMSESHNKKSTPHSKIRKDFYGNKD